MMSAAMRRVPWGVVIALAVVVVGFFALVNSYPVAPPRDRGPQRKVLRALDPSQALSFSASRAQRA